MSKTEIVTELQTILNDLKGITADLKQVAVEMDCRHGMITGDYTCAYSYSYRSIMGNGTVTLLETFEEKEKGLQRIMEHMAPGAKIEFRPEMLTRTAVWQINVYEFTGKERKAK